MKLSIIVPVYNELENIQEFYSETKKVLKGISHEIIFIDDGSKDSSLSTLIRIAKEEKKVKIISFSRNFGKEAAIYAGLKNATGDYNCIIDADLQQDPIYILKMYDFLKYNKEYDSICMYPKMRQENIIMKVNKKIFYYLINKISDIEFKRDASDFRMFTNDVKKAILKIKENNRFSKGIFSWVGFNTHFMEYNVKKRKKGSSKFSNKSLFRYAIDGIIGFSVKPLRIATYMGVLTSVGAIVYFIYVITKTLIVGADTPGYASLISIMLFLGGVELLCIGILGEYISRIFLESKKRPIYLEKLKYNFEDED